MKKTSTVQLVRNATLKIRYAGHTMLIDPVLADKGTLISALGVNKTPRVHLTIPIQDIIGGDRKSTRLNSSHSRRSRMPSSA